VFFRKKAPAINLYNNWQIGYNNFIKDIVKRITKANIFSLPYGEELLSEKIKGGAFKGLS
jgi:hypothetical protein